MQNVSSLILFWEFVCSLIFGFDDGSLMICLIAFLFCLLSQVKLTFYFEEFTLNIQYVGYV